MSYFDCPYCEQGVIFMDEYSLEGECDNCGKAIEASEIDSSSGEEDYPSWERDLYDERFGGE